MKKHLLTTASKVIKNSKPCSFHIACRKIIIQMKYLLLFSTKRKLFAFFVSSFADLKPKNLIIQNVDDSVTFQKYEATVKIGNQGAFYIHKDSENANLDKPEILSPPSLAVIFLRSSSIFFFLIFYSMHSYSHL